MKKTTKETDDSSCTVIDFRGVPETGKAIQFVHAGGKVNATVLKINEDGTFRALGSDGTRYPRIGTDSIMGDSETASSHISRSQVRNINNAANGRITGKETKGKRVASAPGVYVEPAKGSIIHQILELHKQGLTRPQIIAKGFNKSTVARQVGEFIKRQQQTK